jgi:hypothetical protein
MNTRIENIPLDTKSIPIGLFAKKLIAGFRWKTPSLEYRREERLGRSKLPRGRCVKSVAEASRRKFFASFLRRQLEYPDKREGVLTAECAV